MRVGGLCYERFEKENVQKMEMKAEDRKVWRYFVEEAGSYVNSNDVDNGNVN